jgi:hypothetical protein
VARREEGGGRREGAHAAAWRRTFRLTSHIETAVTAPVIQRWSQDKSMQRIRKDNDIISLDDIRKCSQSGEQSSWGARGV